MDYDAARGYSSITLVFFSLMKKISEKRLFKQ